MVDRSATFIVCDDISVSLNGKHNISGMYMGDMSIWEDNFVIPQLSFLITINSVKSKPLKILRVRIRLPGYENPWLLEFPLPPTDDASIFPGRLNKVYRVPIMIPAPVLRPGKIEVVIETESKEIDAGVFWITMTPRPFYQ